MTFNKRIDFKVDEEMYKKIKETAYLNKTSMAQAVRVSLDIFFKRTTLLSQFEETNNLRRLNEKTLS